MLTVNSTPVPNASPARSARCWIVFGDDWGQHPSTTQHLVNALMAQDTVCWVNSIGMRSPRINQRDLNRVMQKLVQGCTRGPTASSGPEPRPDAIIKPILLPYHHRPGLAAVNKIFLRRQLAPALSGKAPGNILVLSALPTVSHYLDLFGGARVAYLRLDDYENLPGVDAAMVRATEQRIYDEADAVFVTARTLLPGGRWKNKSHYLPQGVDWDHFSRVAPEPLRKPVLGFFGLMAEWLDYDLIAAVAERLPDWTLEFIGPVRSMPERLSKIPNFKHLGPRPYSALPESIRHWSAAWVPFLVTPLTQAVNPLKAREYLAAGLPTHCAPLPEARALSEQLLISQSADEIAGWAKAQLTEDSREQRLARRQSVAGDSWQARAQLLRDILCHTHGN